MLHELPLALQKIDHYGMPGKLQSIMFIGYMRYIESNAVQSIEHMRGLEFDREQS